jgi:hypothetical protein
MIIMKFLFNQSKEEKKIFFNSNFFDLVLEQDIFHFLLKHQVSVFD